MDGSIVGPRGVDVERVIGRVVGAQPGPTVVAVVGIHGNEPAGVHAARRVLARIAELRLALHGDFVVLAGNLRSLRAGERYAQRDLNRGWTDAQVERLLASSIDSLDAEDLEQRELHEQLEQVRKSARGPCILVDLHTSSAPGLPFILVGDTVQQRRFVRVFPIPVLLGIVEQIEGVLTEFHARRGGLAFCIEGGQHDSTSSTDALDAVLWMTLARAGLVADSHDDVVRAQRELDAQRRGLPRLLEVLSRHSITPDDVFVMEPGFKNIDPVRVGQLLARDVRGEIRAVSDGVVVLPLYQKLGSDGFFWAREMTSSRLQVSDALRALRLDAVAHLLPGVRRDGHRLVVDSASERVRDVLRLLGYRRERKGASTTWEQPPGA